MERKGRSLFFLHAPELSKTITAMTRGGIFKAPYEYRNNRLGRISYVKKILTNADIDRTIEEKDKVLANFLDYVSLRMLREYVKILLLQGEIKKTDFEGSKIIKLRGI